VRRDPHPRGVVVGRAEAMCSRSENTWRNRDDYAVRSMAETRAESRAFRRAIGWIVSIAGYNPTPAEEMPPTEAGPSLGPDASQDEITALSTLLTVLCDGDIEQAKERWTQIKTVADGHMLSIVARSILIAAGEKA
jgi:hypothetical protein